jgi:hypothetical protein
MDVSVAAISAFMILPDMPDRPSSLPPDLDA